VIVGRYSCENIQQVSDVDRTDEVYELQSLEM
jgi:hypothetical protein